MKIPILRWGAVSVLLASVTGMAVATDVPITFESDTYSTTADPNSIGAPGTIHGQDGWNTLVDFGVGNITVTAVNPIAGEQSLLVNNSSNSTGDARVRAQASGLLNVTVPASMSWLVRVDTLGAGSPTAAASRGVEFGITTDLATGPTPFTIIFNDEGGLQYYNAVNTNFSGDPTYSLNTVYRVDITNISDGSGTYDASIFDNGSNNLVAQVLAAPLQVPVGTQGVYFYAMRRGNTVGNAMIDNIMASGGLPGDFNLDGVVNAADYVVWRDAMPDDSAKYIEWKSNFGAGTPLGGGTNLGSPTNVPEPSSLVLMGTIAAFTILRRTRTRMSD